MFLNCSKEEKLSFPDSGGSSGEITAIKNYGGSKNDVANAVVKTLDGGAVVLGYTQSMTQRFKKSLFGQKKTID